MSIPYSTYFIRNRNRNRNCLRNKGFLPSFTPVINSLSVTTSVAGVYSLVYINGSNFIPTCNGVTYINFGNFKNIPITFYSSFNISPKSFIFGKRSE